MNAGAQITHETPDHFDDVLKNRRKPLLELTIDLENAQQMLANTSVHDLRRKMREAKNFLNDPLILQCVVACI